ncbi:G patch domain-containing protein 11 [Kappamyces sp. JEL0680]|nr:G patch domain-containing protein 11 [Kappamyces sp. JEL0680]
MKRNLAKHQSEQSDSGSDTNSANAEDDYMSGTFLENEPSPDTSSYRLSRIKRQNSTYHQGTKKSKLVERQEELDAGLNQELSSDNKGFRMMQRMGYQQGQVLGSRGEGLAEPVAVQLKNDKLGLGSKVVTTQRFVSIKEKRELEHDMKRKQSHFREAMSDRYSGARLASDLQIARSTCMDMDEKNGIPRTEFWPSEKPEGNLHLDPGVKAPKEPSAELDAAQLQFESQPDSEKLAVLTYYLRTKYHYCQWCSIQFENEQDMDQNCPGDCRIDHED